MFLNPLAVNKKLMNVKVIFNYRFAGGNKVFFLLFWLTLPETVALDRNFKAYIC